MQNLPPPPPLPETVQAAKPREERPASRPFDIVVACISIATLLGIVLFLFPHRRETLAIDGVIRLDAPASAPVDRRSSEAGTAREPSAEATPAEAVAPADPLPQVGSVYEGLLTGIGSGKETKGLAKLKLNGCTVYVRGAARGETVRFKVTEERTSSYGDGRPYYFAEVLP